MSMHAQYLAMVISNISNLIKSIKLQCSIFVYGRSLTNYGQLEAGQSYKRRQPDIVAVVCILDLFQLPDTGDVG